MILRYIKLTVRVFTLSLPRNSSPIVYLALESFSCSLNYHSVRFSSNSRGLGTYSKVGGFQRLIGATEQCQLCSPNLLLAILGTQAPARQLCRILRSIEPNCLCMEAYHFVNLPPLCMSYTAFLAG